MIRRFLLPLAALAGVALAIAMVWRGNQVPPVATPVEPAVRAPFASCVAGTGLIESSGENIAIGTPVAGIVQALHVRRNDLVRAGDPLFTIDDRDLQDELPTARAKVAEAEANLAKTRHALALAETLRESGVNSAEDLSTQRFDLTIAEAELASAQARVDELASEIARRTVRAPAAGRVLQMRIHVGEFAPSGVVAEPLLVLGDDTALHVRVEVDEREAWRVDPKARAVAFVRGNPTFETALSFERIEPLVVPKTTFTGDSTERVDTRVLQVIYSFDPAALRAYVGQQMDVFIEAPTAPESGSH